MSLTQDIQTLRERFLDQWDDDAVLTLFANAESQDVPDDEPFVRFSIIPGSNFLTFGGNDGGLYTQLGRVNLQVFIPSEEGTMAAYEFAQTFTTIFRNWKSDDGCLRCYDFDLNGGYNSEDGYFQVNASIRWESLRR